MMMISPLSPRWSTTCDIEIIQIQGSHYLIRSKWTLKSNIPSPTTIHITTEINEKTRICIEHITKHINEISLPYSSELELDIRMQYNFISCDFDISIVSDTFKRYLRILISISHLSESFSYCRIKISTTTMSYLEHVGEHFQSIFIKDSSSIFIKFVKPIVWDKTRESQLKIRQTFLNFL